ncbi:hypothetical protein MPSEU_000912900 [Mayamaea pseudoterrestris]|nr:hypothetical protein MPSEU_000350100 [Mayamaea pseudoterrestris]GKY99586.1 hypothetical protein MPSEU_000912900 [Mayamaea pseudoterrestris]
MADVVTTKLAFLTPEAHAKHQATGHSMDKSNDKTSLNTSCLGMKKVIDGNDSIINGTIIAILLETLETMDDYGTQVSHGWRVAKTGGDPQNLPTLINKFGFEVYLLGKNGDLELIDLYDSWTTQNALSTALPQKDGLFHVILQVVPLKENLSNEAVSTSNHFKYKPHASKICLDMSTTAPSAASNTVDIGAIPKQACGSDSVVNPSIGNSASKSLKRTSMPQKGSRKQPAKVKMDSEQEAFDSKELESNASGDGDSSTMDKSALTVNATKLRAKIRLQESCRKQGTQVFDSSKASANEWR